jgi:L-fuculose-phosphate aldolase
MLERERELIVRYSRRMHADGLSAGTAGNLSVRTGKLVAITPSGVEYDELAPDGICVIDLDGAPVEGDLVPSTEAPMHLALYRQGDAGAIVHTHSPYATVLSTLVPELPPIHYLIADLGGAVKVAAYATPGSEELAAAVLHAVAGRSAALLRNHGAITVGASLEQAYGRSLTLEWLAALYYRARLLGEPSLLDDVELERLADVMRAYDRP